MSLRIVHVDRQTAWTGQVGRLLRVAVGTQARGHHVRIVTLPDAPLADRAREAGIEVLPLRLRGWRVYPSVVRLVRHLRKHPADILHAHGGRDHQVARVARGPGGVPFLVRTKHNHTPLRGGIFGKAIYAKTDRVIAVSDFSHQLLLRDGIPGDKIATVKTAVDLDRISPRPKDQALRDELGLTDEHVVLGNVSRLATDKGIEEVLRAFAQLQAEPGLGHLRCVLAGNEYDHWQALVDELGIGDVTHLLPYRRDIVPVLSILDIFVMPSHEEALGTSLIEALGMGLPAVAANVGGIPETLIPEVGTLVPPHDAPAVAEALRPLINDAALRRTMGAAGRAFVEKTYSLDRLIDDTIGVYRSLMP